MTGFRPKRQTYKCFKWECKPCLGYHHVGYQVKYRNREKIEVIN